MGEDGRVWSTSGDMTGTLLRMCGFAVVGVDGVCKHTAVRLLLLLSNREDGRSEDDDGEERRKREASTRRPARAWHGGWASSTMRAEMPEAGCGGRGAGASMGEGGSGRRRWPDFETSILRRAGELNVRRAPFSERSVRRGLGRWLGLLSGSPDSCFRYPRR